MAGLEKEALNFAPGTIAWLPKPAFSVHVPPETVLNDGIGHFTGHSGMDLSDHFLVFTLPPARTLNFDEPVAFPP